MSSEFIKNWEPRQESQIGSRIKQVFSPSLPLKSRIEYVCRMIDVQRMKLEQLYSRLYERDRRLFEYLVTYYLKHDMNRANVYANEIAGVRKLAKVILQSKLALEAVRLRLDTVKEMGDVTMVVGPALSVIRNVRARLSSVLPEAERELTDIGNVISDILTEAGHPPTSQFTFETSNEEAEKVLYEAKTMAERKLKESFIEIPSVAEKGKETETESK
ncbi:MAG: Snf7 family protein [Thermoproteota archaeon]|jgi:Conserved protein implicated in secretion